MKIKLRAISGSVLVTPEKVCSTRGCAGSARSRTFTVCGVRDVPEAMVPLSGASESASPDPKGCISPSATRPGQATWLTTLGWLGLVTSTTATLCFLPWSTYKYNLLSLSLQKHLRRSGSGQRQVCNYRCRMPIGARVLRCHRDGCQRQAGQNNDYCGCRPVPRDFLSHDISPSSPGYCDTWEDAHLRLRRQVGIKGWLLSHQSRGRAVVQAVDGRRQVAFFVGDRRGSESGRQGNRYTHDRRRPAISVLIHMLDLG